jgi:hypothetical protein
MELDERFLEPQLADVGHGFGVGRASLPMGLIGKPPECPFQVDIGAVRLQQELA